VFRHNIFTTFDKMDSNLPEKIDLATIRPFIDTADLRRQLIMQLEKDLPNLGVQVGILATDFFAEIHSILTTYIEGLVDYQPDSIPQLLYTIDVSEVKIRLALAKENAHSANQIASAILEKEAQKVFIRNVYSGNIKI
jgi:hypothetical protein